MMLAQENKILSAVVPMTPPAATGNVYELRCYRAHVGRAGEWLGLFKDIMPFRDRFTRRVGLWQTEVAQLNEVVRVWVYRDLNERAAARAKMAQEPECQAFLPKATSLLASMQAIVLNPAPFSPMR
jgi:NIPSNAP protein